MDLTDNDRIELLRIARATLREYLSTGHIPPGKPHTAHLLEPAAVFVSLHCGETLRGCIGTTEAKTPLFRAVQEMAVAAASLAIPHVLKWREELVRVWTLGWLGFPLPRLVHPPFVRGVLWPLVGGSGCESW